MAILVRVTREVKALGYKSSISARPRSEQLAGKAEGAHRTTVLPFKSLSRLGRTLKTFGLQLVSSKKVGGNSELTRLSAEMQ